MKKADFGVAIYLLAAVIFFIIPIPSILLDVMLAINISLAMIILFNALFAKEVLDMSFFPTLLFLVLLVPYIMHYYTLENEVQKMYTQYDEILKHLS